MKQSCSWCQIEKNAGMSYCENCNRSLYEKRIVVRKASKCIKLRPPQNSSLVYTPIDDKISITKRQ